MRPSQSVKHYASQTDYLNKESTKVASNLAPKAKPLGPPASAEVSPAAKSLRDDLTKQSSKVEEVAKAASSETGSALSHLAGEASEVLATGIKQMAPSLPIKEVTPASEMSAPRMNQSATQINKPAIFIIEGFSLFSGSSGGGLPEIQKNMVGSELYSWRDEDKMLAEIMKRPLDRPVVLVGHSLGGDVAVNLAKRLNTLENGYRKVELLVTLDSVGFDNDIIPPNVKKNLNFIGDEDAFFNDGPNIARDNRYTEVVNELRSEGHREIDEADDIHFKIFTAVQDVLGPDIAARMLESNRVRAITNNLLDRPLR